MAAVIQRYLDEVVPDKAHSTQDGNKLEARTLTAVFGKMRPDEITAADVWDFMQARGKKSRVRANRERSLLMDIMRHAIMWGHCRDNPVREVKPFREQPRTRYVTDTEFEAVKAIAPPIVAAMMELARLTGQRRGDLLALRRDAITDDGLIITQSKTARSRPVSICIQWSTALRAAVNALLVLDRPIASTWLVTSRDGSPITVEGWKTAWGRTMDKALREGVITERFHFHDLRAKTVTELKAAGRDAKSLSGHASDAMVDKVYDRRSVKKAAPLE
ncbi:MAG TPA: tyrosine-type recombinase/integrase [Azoarcus taiwanensis]|nr:tyrosine-type recombinase/integrase [Azoarcus taiwanensis]